LNLVTNAIDACIDIDCTQKQGQVTLRTTPAKGWALAFEVIDNGCGMDTETCGKIFQRFFSTKGSRGTGLGLMITKKIIDEHQGTITFESTPGKGTHFVFKLPKKDPPPQVNSH
jgi:signal transduction histidine kinase